MRFALFCLAALQLITQVCLSCPSWWITDLVLPLLIHSTVAAWARHSGDDSSEPKLPS